MISTKQKCYISFNKQQNRKTQVRNKEGFTLLICKIIIILPCITAIAEQEAVLPVTAATHLAVGLLQVQIYCVFLALLSRLLHRYLDEATDPQQSQTSQGCSTDLPFKIRVNVGTYHFLYLPSIAFSNVDAVEGGTVYRTRVCILHDMKKTGCFLLSKMKRREGSSFKSEMTLPSSRSPPWSIPGCSRSRNSAHSFPAWRQAAR